MVIAYERYILVVKAAEKEAILTAPKRKAKYFVSTAVIVSCFLADASYSYAQGYWICWRGFRTLNNHMMSELINLGLTSVFSFIPALLCIYYYFQTSLVLLARKHKVGRNLNLVFCFSTICGVWIICTLVRTALNMYVWVIIFTVRPLKHVNYPFALPQNYGDLGRQFGSVTSLIDPWLILLSQKDYRKPFLDKIEAIKERLKLCFSRP